MDKKMELQVLENIQKFAWNFEEIKTELAEYTKKYVGLVVNDDNLKDMEKTQKEIGTLRIKVEKFRKETKKALEDPAKLFDAQAKELQDIIANVENPIKEQLQKYEDERIVKAESELMEYAKTIAAGDGLRDENFTLVIPSRWTNRTAKVNQVRQEIIAELGRMLQDQNLKDAAIALKKQKEELIIQLCQSASELYSLNTPITPRDVAYLTSSAELGEIAGIIKDFCQKRADVELEAARVAALAAQAAKEAEEKRLVQEQSIVEQPIPEQSMPEQRQESISEKPQEAPLKREPSRYNLTLQFENITIEQAQKLCNYLKETGITCKTISKEKVQ